MHFSWSKTPFPGHSECFVAVVLTSCQKSCRILDVSRSPKFWGGRPSKSYTNFTTPVVLMFLCMFFKMFFCYKSEKTCFYVFFIRKSMFLTFMAEWYDVKILRRICMLIL